jgi:tetratricopeptide (TPR) repeat protein
MARNSIGRPAGGAGCASAIVLPAGIEMDWASDWLGASLRCDVSSGTRLIVIVLGAAACAATILATTYAVYRRIRGPDGPRTSAARALRDEAKAHLKKGSLPRALALVDLAIEMNPRAGYAYYVRGLIWEERGNGLKAIADWKRCLKRLPNFTDAKEKLLRYESAAPRPGSSWALTYGAAAVLVFIVVVGVLAN